MLRLREEISATSAVSPPSTATPGPPPIQVRKNPASTRARGIEASETNWEVDWIRPCSSIGVIAERWAPIPALPAGLSNRAVPSAAATTIPTPVNHSAPQRSLEL